MITQQALKNYGHTDITQYFEAMLEQKLNGNNSTLRRQFRGLGRDQRKEFLSYLLDGIRRPHIIASYSPEIIGDALKMCIEEIY